jgi:hypothetical protein
MTTDQSKQCVITNNSGCDVIVALSTNADEGNTSNSIAAVNGQLEVLKTSSGSPVIKNGGSNTITLDRSFSTNSGESGDVPYYDLQICDSNWLYPIANLPLTLQSNNGATNYAPLTIAKEDLTGMSEAVNFYQTILAFPSSQLATDYYTALQAAKDAAVSKADGSPDSATASAMALDNAMSSFFKSTTNYESVTLGGVVAIANYYNNFPAIWAQYKDDLTYYLYSSDETTACFAGVLTLKKTGQLDVTKANGGYSCSFIPAVAPTDTSRTDVDPSRAVSLTYKNGLFVDDPKATDPNIGLIGSFFVKRLFTNEPADNSLLSVITGNINGTPSIGFDVAQTPQATVQQATPALTSSTNSFEQYWDTLIHPKSQQDLIISILTLAGAILLIPAVASAVYGIYRIIKYKAAVKEALEKQIVERRYSQNVVDENESISSKVEPLKFGTRLGDYFIEFNPKNIEGYQRVIQNDAKADKLIEAFETQSTCLDHILEFAEILDVRTVQNALSQLDQISTSVERLTNSKRTDLDTVLPEEFQNFKNVQVQVQFIDTKVRLQLSEDAQTIVDDNITLGQKIYDDLQKSSSEDTHEDMDEDPELENKIVPEPEPFENLK